MRRFVVVAYVLVVTMVTMATGSLKSAADGTPIPSVACSEGAAPIAESWAHSAFLEFSTIFIPDDSDQTRLIRDEAPPSGSGVTPTPVERVKRQLRLARVCLLPSGSLTSATGDGLADWRGVYSIYVESGTIELRFAAGGNLAKKLAPDPDEPIDVATGATVTLGAGESVVFEDVDVDVVNPASDNTATFLVQQLLDVTGPGCVTKCFGP